MAASAILIRMSIKHNILLFVAMLAFMLCHPCSVQSQSKYTVSTDVLNVRTGSGTNAPVAGVLHLYDTVTVYSESDGWATILYDGDSCYVSMQYLTPNIIQNILPFDISDSKVQTILIVILVLIVLLYIFCAIQVQNDDMVVIQGWSDLIMLIVPWLLIAIMMPSLMFNEESVIKEYRFLYYALCAAGALMLLFSLIRTVIANSSSPILMILAVLMKLIIIPLIPLGLLYIGFKERDTIPQKLGVLKVFLIFGVIIGLLMSFDD